MIRVGLISGLLTSFSPALWAMDVGQSDYMFVSDLSAQGFEPFGTGGSGNTLFGMSNGREIYLCFLLDTPEDQSIRQTALIAELKGNTADRTIPNIPVVCVMTQ